MLDREPATAGSGLAELRAQVAAQVVGREREIDLVLAAVAAGRDLLIEGPPGTSKTTLLKAITSVWQIPLVFVEGNADLTPAKLIGHHNPSRVLREDYSADNFVDGPLVTAMRSGGFLYIEELNRSPDDTLNTLLTAMAERSIAVPRVGVIEALPSFRVVASMNPFDNVGTTRLSSSVHDRLCRLAVGYQDAQTERRIVVLRANPAGIEAHSELQEETYTDAVALTRGTRSHPDVRQGSSVRGAIDLALVARQLLEMRGIEEPGSGRLHDNPARQLYAEAIFDAAILALSGRIHVDEATEQTPEGVIRELWEDRFVLEPAAASPG